MAEGLHDDEKFESSDHSIFVLLILWYTNASFIFYFVDGSISIDGFSPAFAV